MRVILKALIALAVVANLSSGWKLSQGLRQGCAACILTLGSLGGFAHGALASEVRQVGSIETGGFLPGFKDTLKIESIADPLLPTVHLFLADFEKPLAEKVLSNDLFSDPSSASLTCVSTGKVNAADLAALPTKSEGEDIFSESKSMFKGKSIKIKRVFDKKTNTVIYASFSTRLFNNDDANKSRFKSSICAVSLEPEIQSSSSP